MVMVPSVPIAGLGVRWARKVLIESMGNLCLPPADTVRETTPEGDQNVTKPGDMANPRASGYHRIAHTSTLKSRISHHDIGFCL